MNNYFRLLINGYFTSPLLRLLLGIKYLGDFSITGSSYAPFTIMRNNMLIFTHNVYFV